MGFLDKLKNVLFEDEEDIVEEEQEEKEQLPQPSEEVRFKSNDKTKKEEQQEGIKREVPKPKESVFQSFDEEEFDRIAAINKNRLLERDRKAREEKEIDYNKDRLKKIRDTQFDILNSLDLKEYEKKEENPVKSAKEEELMTLINTITSKELAKTSKLDPFDILSDLKGSDNTQVLSGIEEEVKKDDTKKMIEKEKLENSFYTTTNAFTQSDFDDFNDLKDDLKATKIIIRVLIVLIIIAFIAGALFFLNNYFHIF